MEAADSTDRQVILEQICNYHFTATGILEFDLKIPPTPNYTTCEKLDYSW
jgi:hypothetical protein